MTYYPPKGLIVPLITPLTEKGGIDFPSLGRQIERVLPHCEGVMIGEGLVGEGLSLPNPLRRDLLRAALEAVAGKKPVFLFPTAATTEETWSNMAALSRECAPYEGKERLFWADIPLWYHSNRKLPQHYQEWARATPFPFVLYNHPLLISGLNRSLKRNNIRTAVLKKLAENERMVGLIQAGDLSRTIHYQRAVRGRREFRIYDGDEMNFLNSPSSAGVVSGGANLLTAEWRETVTASLRLSEDPAANLLLLQQSQKLRELSRVLKKSPAPALKAALQRLGWIARAEVLEETRAASPPELPEIDRFLQANFSLQPPS